MKEKQNRPLKMYTLIKRIRSNISQNEYFNVQVMCAK